MSSHKKMNVRLDSAPENIEAIDANAFENIFFTPF